MLPVGFRPSSPEIASAHREVRERFRDLNAPVQKCVDDKLFLTSSDDIKQYRAPLLYRDYNGDHNAFNDAHRAYEEFLEAEGKRHQADRQGIKKHSEAFMRGSLENVMRAYRDLYSEEPLSERFREAHDNVRAFASKEVADLFQNMVAGRERPVQAVFANLAPLLVALHHFAELRATKEMARDGVTSG